jgi:hypothetical protein
MKGERIEKVVDILYDREPSDKYPGHGWSFDFKDEDGVKYEWNTTTWPDNFIHKDQKWLVRMTIEGYHECLGFPYTRVKNVRFIKKMGE